jgi:short-subunit dehydrogenase
VERGSTWHAQDPSLELISERVRLSQLITPDADIRCTGVRVPLRALRSISPQREDRRPVVYKTRRMETLEDRVALVTGAASGIGRALAFALAGQGSHLALVDRDAAELEEVGREVRRGGRRVSTYEVDVADRQAMAALPERVLRDHGAVHVLVNNAGVSVSGPFLDLELADLDWIVGVNFWGVVHGCKFLLPLLLRQEEAHIVNVCSSFALMGFARKTAYAATKFAVRGFSESLAAELAGSRVGLTVLYPGAVDTAIIRRARATDPQQREAEARFLAARAHPARLVAERTIRAIRRKQRRVLIGRDYHLIDWLSRLSPGLAARLAARLATRLPF